MIYSRSPHPAIGWAFVAFGTTVYTVLEGVYTGNPGPIHTPTVSLGAFFVTAATLGIGWILIIRHLTLPVTGPTRVVCLLSFVPASLVTADHLLLHASDLYPAIFAGNLVAIGWASACLAAVNVTDQILEQA